MTATETLELDGVRVLRLPDLKTQKNRLLGYRGDRSGGKLVVASAKEVHVYLVEFDPETGKYLLAHQTDGDAAIYQCGPGGCDCWGNRRWGSGNCKHQLALAELGLIRIGG